MPERIRKVTSCVTLISHCDENMTFGWTQKFKVNVVVNIWTIITVIASIYCSVNKCNMDKDPFDMDNGILKYLPDTTTISMPEGIKELLEILSREVLREQPSDIVAFLANYLQNMTEARRKAPGS